MDLLLIKRFSTQLVKGTAAFFIAIFLFASVLPIFSVKESAYGILNSESNACMTINSRAFTPEKEPNNDFGNATWASSGTGTIWYWNGTVDNETDASDFYKINVSAAQMLTVLMNFSGVEDCDLDLILYDEYEEYLDASYYGETEYVAYPAEEDTFFYVEVNAWTGRGTYELTFIISSLPAPDNNDNFSSAATLTAGVNKNGELLRNYDHSDFYKIFLKNSGTTADEVYITLDTSSNALPVNFDLYLYDPFGFNCIPLTSEGGDPLESISFIANTQGWHFIEVYLHSDSDGYPDSPSGKYVLRAELTPNVEYENDGNNEPANATRLTNLTGFLSGTLSASDINDFFVYQASNGEIINMTMSVSQDADFDVYLCKYNTSKQLPDAIEIIDESYNGMGETEYIYLNVTPELAGDIYLIISYWDGAGYYGFNNIPPVLHSFTPNNSSTIFINSTQAVNFTVNASDPNGDDVVVFWYVNHEQVPDWTEKYYNFTHEFTGNYTITAEITDYLQYLYVNWSVVVNGRPIIVSTSPPAFVYMYEGENMTFTIDVYDPDTPFRYEWYLDGNLTQSVSSSYTYSTGFNDSGMHDVMVKVNDSSGQYSTWSWEVRVRDFNRPPIVSYNIQPGTVVINEGETLYLNITATDPDGDALNITWHLNGIYKSAGANYTFPTNTSSAANYNIIAVITDGANNITATWYLTVRDVALPPQIVNFAPSEFNITIKEDSSPLMFSVMAVDPDGLLMPDNLRWYVDNVFNITEWNFTYIPNYASAGNHTIVCSISDATSPGVFTNITWNLTVENVKRAPSAVISAPGNGASFKEGDTINFDGSESTDPDSDSLNFTWFKGDTVLSHQPTFTTTLGKGSYQVVLVVRDSYGLNATASVSFSVEGEDNGSPAYMWMVIPVFFVITMAFWIRKRKIEKR